MAFHINFTNDSNLMFTYLYQSPLILALWCSLYKLHNTFTYPPCFFKNIRYQKKVTGQNTDIWIIPPPLIIDLRMALSFIKIFNSATAITGVLGIKFCYQFEVRNGKNLGKFGPCFPHWNNTAKIGSLLCSSDTSSHFKKSKIVHIRVRLFMINK